MTARISKVPATTTQLNLELQGLEKVFPLTCKYRNASKGIFFLGTIM